jgi:hypothetical protein
LTVVVAVCPSVLIAVTVKVCAPGVEVSSAPGETDPLLSWQDAIPGPTWPSVQLKFVATFWPTAYTPPDAGELTVATGAAIESTDTVLPTPRA